MFSETIRRYGFWLFDALSGGRIRKNFLDLDRKLQGGADTTSDDLRKLLDHAVHTTDFYGRFRGYSGITEFPVIKKKLVRDHYDQFISSDYKNKPLHKMSTSGSSGERFVMLQDRQKRKRVLAEVLYFHERCGFRLGSRYVYVKVWNKEGKKHKLIRLAENLVMFDCSCLSDKSMQGLFELLKKDRAIKCLTGYANSLAAIASYFDQRGYTPDMFHIEIVACGAERIEPRSKALLEKVFGCPVVSRYSNQENGVLAQQPVCGENFILNTAHYFFETLRLDADEPASDGEPARLVLTDLYNYAMPLIRYDTEDIVVTGISGEAGAKRKVLTDISGRKEDIIYDTRGNMLNPYLIALAFRRYDRLPRFQFIQENQKKFTLKLEGVRGMYADDDFRQTVEKLVGKDAVITIEHMDQIPHLSSGKFRRMICNYKAMTDR
jgi:phenylacetate-CoA ligase